MSLLQLPDALVDRGSDGGKIVLVVLDGIGGLPHPDTGRTELESARTPNLDDLAAGASLGMLRPVGPGISPGSGPGHLALFGYDPTRFVVGRGVLAALGVGFDLRHGDVAARLNLASLDGEGRITDRRAGRPSDGEGQRIVERVRDAMHPPKGVEVFLMHVKEHRAVLVLRGGGLEAAVADTDPQETGVPPLAVTAIGHESQRTAEMAQDILDQAQFILADEPQANVFLARGFAQFEDFPSFRKRYGLRAAVVARYPMYRGVARLVGMTVAGEPESDEEALALLETVAPENDFCFFHFKATDSRGEDGDFDGKVAAIETADALLERIRGIEPDVLVVTGDHSTPATYGAHSWHSVPLLIASRWARPTATRFAEHVCRVGDIGTIAGRQMMALALAHAGRLRKFGA